MSARFEDEKSIEEAARLFRFARGGTPVESEADRMRNMAFMTVRLGNELVSGSIDRHANLTLACGLNITFANPQTSCLAVVVHPDQEFSWSKGYHWLVRTDIVLGSTLIFPPLAKDGWYQQLNFTIIKFERAIDRVTYVRLSHWPVQTLQAGLCDKDVIENVLSRNVCGANCADYPDRVIVQFDLKLERLKTNEEYRFHVLDCLLRFGPVRYLAFHQNPTKVFVT